MKGAPRFLLALGFLTRLTRARMAEDTEFSASWPYFPLVGLVLGGVLAAPFALGFLRGHTWVQAWLLLGGSLFLTRGLHWDGWADLWDGWGSGAKGERFWEVLKDSRIGAFGVMGLVMGLLGQMFLFRTALSLEAYKALVFAFILGRGSAVVLACRTRDLARPGLGRTFIQGATKTVVLVTFGQVLLAGAFLLPLPALTLSLAVTVLGLAGLMFLARKKQGVNGDFLGAAIVWGELAGLLGWSLVSGATLA
ncbi:MAG: adenosylcobinamide-GDP ribazoletransferase [Thermodesulfobacteriota bacterium]|nr:adenosylcobinamide-GDP ribazoletransferase [Thermodesulfobacteriota bacterium]